MEISLHTLKVQGMRTFHRPSYCQVLVGTTECSINWHHCHCVLA